MGLQTEAGGVVRIIPLVQALQTVGNDGFGNGVGFTPIVRQGYGPEVKDIINRNLLAGLPTIVAINDRNTEGDGNPAVRIAGWDNKEKAYRVLDPMDPRATLFGLTLPGVQDCAGRASQRDVLVREVGHRGTDERRQRNAHRPKASRSSSVC